MTKKTKMPVPIELKFEQEELSFVEFLLCPKPFSLIISNSHKDNKI